MFKLIFTFKFVLSLLQNNLINGTLQLYCIFFVYLPYFDCHFEDWSVVRLLYFVLSLLDTLFYFFFPEIIVKLIFYVCYQASKS